MSQIFLYQQLWRTKQSPNFNSYNMSFGGDLKTDTKGKKVEKITLNFKDMIFSGRCFRMTFFPWIRTNELKKMLVKEKFNDKYKHLTEQDIRLFYKNIQMDQEHKNPFDIYKIEDDSTIVITQNSNSHNTEQGVINPYRLFDQIPQELINLLLNVQSGLNAGKNPKLASEGTSGTYFLETNQKKKAAVFKPYDEEPYTPNNPRGYPGEVGSQGIRKGVLSGECATREVAAYLLDATHRFHGVPPTTYVEFYHPCFIFKELCQTPIVSQTECNLHKAKTKHGSLQQFIQYNDVVGNLGSHQFSTSEVHKIAILDLRILNCDRNQANILVVKKMIDQKNGSIKATTLIPIDHGLSFPDNFEIYDYQVVWMSYKQSKQPLSSEELQYIENIDPVKDCQTLREKLGFRQICLRNFRIAETFLKRLAKERFTLYEIGRFAYREEEEEQWSSAEQQEEQGKKENHVRHSELEKLVMEAEFIYHTVKSNGIRSTAQFQMGFSKNKKQSDESKNNGFVELKDMNSQEGLFGIPLNKRPSRVKDTSIEREERSSKGKRSRNISLPNLKKKISTKERRLRMKKKKVKDRGLYTKEKQEKWGDLFYHYFEELLERFVVRKLDLRNGWAKEKTQPRPRLLSEDVDL